jgi:hypothetical protein
VTYEQAKALQPGDVIEYTDGSFGLHRATVTNPVHPFPFNRGRVVYVPIRGAMIVHTKIVRRIDG